jgi:hypothetical protein
MTREEVRLDKHAMDVDTAGTLAGVVRLLRQAALRACAATDRAGARSPGQLFAFGVDLAADQAREDVINIDGPVPSCGEPAGLLRSAEQVWAVSWPAWTPTISISSLPCWGMPAAAGRQVIPQMTPQASGCDDGRDRFRCLTRISRQRAAPGPASHCGRDSSDLPAGPWRVVG